LSLKHAAKLEHMAMKSTGRAAMELFDLHNISLFGLRAWRRKRRAGTNHQNALPYSAVTPGMELACEWRRQKTTLWTITRTGKGGKVSIGLSKLRKGGGRREKERTERSEPYPDGDEGGSEKPDGVATGGDEESDEGGSCFPISLSTLLFLHDEGMALLTAEDGGEEETARDPVSCTAEDDNVAVAWEGGGDVARGTVADAGAGAGIGKAVDVP
jgi:hypothetical protein